MNKVNMKKNQNYYENVKSLHHFRIGKGFIKHKILLLIKINVTILTSEPFRSMEKAKAIKRQHL